ncbi:MAG: hypothetical protein AAFR18_22375 [Cyanobacteria bacterium J06627_32]
MASPALSPAAQTYPKPTVDSSASHPFTKTHPVKIEALLRNEYEIYSDRI